MMEFNLFTFWFEARNDWGINVATFYEGTHENLSYRPDKLGSFFNVQYEFGEITFDFLWASWILRICEEVFG